jgi:penicillin-binding protein 1A
VQDLPGDLSRGSPSERSARKGRSYGAAPEDEVDLAYVRREWRRRRRRRRGGRSRRVVAVVLLLLLVVALSGAAALVLIVRSPGPVVGCDLASAHPHLFGRNSFLYAADGSPLGTVPTGRDREPVPLWRMSRWLPRATVAIEDRRFWRHGALDYEAIARAALANLKAGRIVQGGSTITQQLVRDRYLGHRPMTLRRKLQEACLAVELAQGSSRRRLLKAYLNLVFYGHHAYGAQAAAWTYFSRPARRLTLAQAALLAGLPQAPSLDDPFRYPRAALARRNEVLAAIRSAGEISPGRYRAAAASSLGLRPGHRYSRVRFATFFDYALRELVHRSGGVRARDGGLRVETTLDPRLQGLADRAVAGWLHRRSDPAAAVVAIDPRNGAIRAMTAGDPGHRRLRFNLASQSRRQAGSAFKVFTLTAAVERGIPLSSVWRGPASLTIPSRRCLNANGPWVVHNFADESTGTMTLQQAIAHSVNTIFAQVVMRVGPARVVAVAHRMGIRSPLKPVCSITLGPEGVSPLEMTDAFATLAASGVRHDPTALRRVAAANGAVLSRLRAAGTRALAPPVAERVTQALTGVVRAGTGTAADPGRPAAGKTGTAEDFKDAWFCGYVPQLAACVWIGYPQAEIPMRNLDGFAQVVGGSIPARIWHDFMVAALRGQPVRPLPGTSARRPHPAPARQPARFTGGAQAPAT